MRSGRWEVGSEMIEFLKSWVLNIATIAILLVLIEILIPSGKTKKLVNLISGFLLLITIIQPFFKILWKDSTFDWINEIDNSFTGLSNMDINKGEFREEQISQIIKVYRKRVENRISEIAREVEGVKDAEVDIILNEDFSSPKFGEIKRIYVYLEVDYIEKEKEYENEGEIAKNKDFSITPIKEISEVKIYIGKQNSEPENHIIEKYKNDSVIMLEEKLNRAFMLKKEDIVISFK